MGKNSNKSKGNSKKNRNEIAERLRKSVARLPGCTLKEAANAIHMDYGLAIRLSKEYGIKPIKAAESSIIPTNNADVGIVVVDEDTLNKVIELTELKKEMEEASDKKEEKEVARKNIKTPLTEEQIKNLIDDYNNNMSIKSICTKYNRSDCTVYKTLKEYGIISKRKRKNNSNELANDTDVKSIETNTTITMDELEKICDSDNSSIKEISNSVISLAPEKEENAEFYKNFGLDKIKLNKIEYDKTVSVGLVADRHDMPVSSFIFNFIGTDLMFDYNQQEQICNDFINKHFTFKNGKADETLVLYVTGLQSALGSIIKTANERKINLTLKHYNASDKKYYSQPIFGGEAKTVDNPFATLDVYGKGAYFYKCSPEDFANGDESEVYSIKLTQYKDFNVDCAETTAAIVTNSFDKIWEIYPEILKTINKTREVKMGIAAHNSKISNGKFCWGNSLTKGYNK